MTLETGTRLGPYEIVAPLGAGGMGEVYRGRDSRLNRDVAIKVLPSSLADTPSARERFHREARAISQLNHPHICALFDIGGEDDAKYLVMELLEGKTLAERLESGPMPLEDVLRYGAQIAEALAFAHANGIAHRDLKPGNVMLMKSGAKVLDFGLAKTILSTPSSVTDDSATQQKALTVDGSIIGTPQYMSPEQVEGRAADARSDIFALGAILYEMATGQPAFQGPNRPAVMAAVLQSEVPPVSSRQPQAPPSFDRLVRMCLAKDPDARWQSMHDVAAQLRWIAEEPSRAGVSARPSRRWIWATAAAAVVALVALSFLAAGRLRDAPRGLASRFTISVPDGAALYSYSGPVAISPDGRTIAFFAHTEGTYKLWLRPLDALEPRQVDGSEGGSVAFWSRDSRRVGFVAGQKLKVFDLEAGSIEVLGDVPPFAMGTFNERGDILLGSIGTGIQLITAGGGALQSVTTVDRSRGELAHLYPSFLPDGTEFLYSVQTADPEQAAVYLGSVDGKAKVRLIPGHSAAVYSAPGSIIHAAGDKLLATPFDLRTRKVGRARPVAEDLGGPALFSVSSEGTLVYGTSASHRTSLNWSDRGGRRISSVPSEGDVIQLQLSPAGDRILLEQIQGTEGFAGIWLRNTKTGAASRVTFGGATWMPVWSDREEEIAVTTFSGRGTRIALVAADGSGGSRVLVDEPSALIAAGDIAQGHAIYTRADERHRYDVWWLRRGETTPRPLFATPFDEIQPQVSPDGRWIAYSSNETGRLEVYVRAFPSAGGKVPISVSGGTQPRWAPDGRELFFVSPKDELMSVRFTPGPTPIAAEPAALLRFTPRRHFNSRFDYDVAPDGSRFILNEAIASEGGEIVVITNWRSLVDGVEVR